MSLVNSPTCNVIKIKTHSPIFAYSLPNAFFFIYIKNNPTDLIDFTQFCKSPQCIANCLSYIAMNVEKKTFCWHWARVAALLKSTITIIIWIQITVEAFIRLFGIYRWASRSSFHSYFRDEHDYWNREIKRKLYYSLWRNCLISDSRSLA